MVLQPGRRTRGGHHPRAARRSAPQAGLGHVLGHRGAPSSTRPSARSCTRCSTAKRCSAACTSRPTAWPRRPAPSSRWPGAPQARGAVFQGSTKVIGIEQSGGRVTGVATADGRDPRRHRGVLRGILGSRPRRDGRAWTSRCCRWRTSTSKTEQIPELVGRNTELAEAGLPILRHQDQDLYYREHVDRLGIGSYAHRPMPVDLRDLAESDDMSSVRTCRRCCRSPRRTSRPSWEQSK